MPNRPPGFQNFSSADLEEMGIEDPKAIRIRPLAQTFLAFQGEIDRMSRMPDVFGSRKIYDETFRKSYLNAEVRRIVLAYKIGLRLSKTMRELYEIAPQKYGYAISKANNRVWALLIQALFNNSKLLSTCLDGFGAGLTKQVAFKESLKKLASARVLPILKSVLCDPVYRDKIAAEKYSFLRTKELFHRCMAVAEQDYEWSRQSL